MAQGEPPNKATLAKEGWLSRAQLPVWLPYSEAAEIPRRFASGSFMEDIEQGDGQRGRRAAAWIQVSRFPRARLGHIAS